VWLANNAGTANASSIAFTPLTDTVAALDDMADASISIGALTVQPATVTTCGSTGTILAGTGDPNDALDSYYGAGILRSTDGGNTWSLIRFTADQRWGFRGEGFAGFAWSTVNPQVVVAAVSQAYKGTLVNAVLPRQSYEGLYYSADAGATWNLATIADGAGNDVQGPNDVFDLPDGNAATSVVWNPARQLFIAAVRFHGYYQSSDGMTFTRMVSQPGNGLTAQNCPSNASLGEVIEDACPIFRGTLAVNPQTGDTFAWTVDFSNQDQGLWQDTCAIGGGACTTNGIAFPTQLNTAALEANTGNGPATIVDGDYTLALAAFPLGAEAGQDTILAAGGDDLWRCSLAEGCVWRNTTNATTCMSAQVAPYQHTLAWSAGDPLEVFLGNDGGLWRTEDGFGYTDTTDPVCSANDTTHYQNLNGSLGSLAEVVSMSQTGATPYTLMTGLGVNGTAGVKGGSEPSGAWPQILGGYGGPVAIDPFNDTNWYVNNEAGVSIYLCAQAGACTPADFGTTPAVDDSDVGGDGYTMTLPAPILVDPLDSSQLLIGTCRLWRGPASGIGWSKKSNAVSPVLDDPASTGPCSGDSVIRSLAALPLPASTALPGGGEAVYVGMFGTLDVGGNSAGHLWSATYNAGASIWSAWTDLALLPVANDANPLNCHGFDISSIFIDPHDTTGQTVYVTVEGNQTVTINDKCPSSNVVTLYGLTNGGTSWANLDSNLPPAPANSVAVDPEDANTVYVATDAGVWSTRTIDDCASAAADCWSAFGSGLPMAPVVQLSASPPTAMTHSLVAATYGRGVWQAPLWGQASQFATATASPNPLIFANPVAQNASATLPVTVTNAGSPDSADDGALIVTAISISTDSADFSASDGGSCIGATLQPGQNCTVQVTFTPSTLGEFLGKLTVSGNLAGGSLTVPLSGTGVACAGICLSTSAINFNVGTAYNGVIVGNPSAQFPLTIDNGTAAAVSYNAAMVGPFSIASNACPGSVPTGTACQMELIFTPSQAGAATGTLNLSLQVGSQTETQSVSLSGTGLAPATDTLSATSLNFPDTIDGTSSTTNCTSPTAANPYCTITLTNTGSVPLTCIVAWAGGIAAPPPNCNPQSSSGEFAESDNCHGQLAANSSCAIAVAFTPNAVGPQNGTLTIYDSQRTQTVALSGTGLESPAFGVSPTSLTFSTQNEGTASPPQTLTITNSGGAPMANVGFEITGTGASSFSCGTTVCSATTCGATLASRSSCTVQMTFAPLVAGTIAANLTITSSTLGVGAYTVPLNGSGTAVAGLNVTPAQLTFGSQQSPVFVGQSSLLMVTVSNNGSATANALTFALSGSQTFAISPTQNNCGSSLAAGTSCYVGVIFTPTTYGAATGTLTVSSGSLTGSVALSGMGAVTAAINVTPATIPAFAITGVGGTSPPVTVTVTNPGSTQALDSLAVTVTGGFSLVSNNCGSAQQPGTLGAGASCTVSVAFQPLGTGTQTGSLTVSSSTVPTGGAAALSANLPLSGVGFNFALCFGNGSPPCVTSSSQTVSSGMTASLALAIVPASGLSGAFTYNLQCGTGLPSNTVCSFPGATNNAVTINGSNTDSVTVQIATGSVSSARWAAPDLWGMLPVACGLVLLPFGCKRQRWTLLLVALAAILTGGVCSCAGSGGGTGGGSGGGGGGTTAAGTYTMPISVTSTGVTQTVNLTLTVD
jgi:hypothetical protein